MVVSDRSVDVTRSGAQCHAEIPPTGNYFSSVRIIQAPPGIFQFQPRLFSAMTGALI